MSVLLDFGVLIVFLYFIISGYKNGFIISLLSFLNVIASFIVSLLLSGFISDFVYLNLVRPRLIWQIQRSIINGNNGIDGILSFLPSFIFNIITNQRIIVNDINHIIYNGKDFAPELIADIISPVIIYFIKFIIIAIVFVLSAIILRVLKNAILNFLKVPVLRGFDSVFGMIFGAVKGFISLILLSVFLEMAVLLGNFERLPLMQIVNDTSIFKVFYGRCSFNTLFREL